MASGGGYLDHLQGLVRGVSAFFWPALALPTSAAESLNVVPHVGSVDAAENNAPLSEPKLSVKVRKPSAAIKRESRWQRIQQPTLLHARKPKRVGRRPAVAVDATFDEAVKTLTTSMSADQIPGFIQAFDARRTPRQRLNLMRLFFSDTFPLDIGQTRLRRPVFSLSQTIGFWKAFAVELEEENDRRIVGITDFHTQRTPYSRLKLRFQNEYEERLWYRAVMYALYLRPAPHHGLVRYKHTTNCFT